MDLDASPAIRDRRAEYKATVQKAADKAAALWTVLDKNQRTAVRFGMFPKEVMDAAAGEGVDQHELCVALMDCATKDGGMRA